MYTIQFKIPVITVGPSDLGTNIYKNILDYSVLEVIRLSPFLFDTTKAASICLWYDCILLLLTRKMCYQRLSILSFVCTNYNLKKPCEI